jgi:uncharacterized protein YceK
MNWKTNLAWCLLLTVGIAVVGCSAGSVENNTADATSPPTANASAQQTSDLPAATNVTLVTLDLPGMT